MRQKTVLLILLSFSLAGGFWALKAQDPPPKQPSQVRQDPPVLSATQTVQTDLSGTYAGTFNCEAAGLTGDTTLTINGNEFTTADGKSGRIVASTTHGYTAVALQIAATDPAATPTIISLRARKSGSRLTLSSVSGSTQKCTFVPSRNMARSRRNQRPPAATGAEVSNPAAAPATVPTTVPAENPVPSQTPSPSQTPAPSPTPTPSPSPTPSGSPTPMPSPSPLPTPSPGEPIPTPTPSEPAPSPTPSPSPTPTPSPSPRVFG